MKNFVIIAFCLFVISSLNAQENFKIDNHNLKWYLDYEKAKEVSSKEKKPILLYFTGSDWCGACKLLEDNYFAKKQFKKLSKSFVLVEVDFIKKTFDKEYAIQNREKLEWKFDLKNKFNAKEFPTLIILDKDENVRGRIKGYLGDDTPKKFTNLLKAILDSQL